MNHKINHSQDEPDALFSQIFYRSVLKLFNLDFYFIESLYGVWLE